MAAILERLAAEDAGLPDPSTIAAGLGRAQSARSNIRWNRDLPDMAVVREVSVPSDGALVPCRVLVPQGNPRGTILVIHGGGWAFCSMDTHERAARLLAIEAQAVVVMCDYRLAPEHSFPAGLNDCIAVWRLLSAGEGPFAGFDRPMAISGDSAGANLAMALMLTQGILPPAFALLFYGVYDADFTTPSYLEWADGPGLSRGKMMRYWDWYAPELQRADPRLAPIRASDAALRALPPLYLNAAEIDPLRSDSERLYARLTALSRADQFRLHGGVVHGFMQMSLELEEARQALADAGAAFRAFAHQGARSDNNREREQ
jgi:acetyl esterase